MTFSEAGVEHVFDDEHMPPGDVDIDVLEDPHHSGGSRPGTVRRDGHPFDARWHTQGPGEVGHHHHCTLEDAHQQQIETGVIGVYLTRDLLQPHLYFLRGEQHLNEVAIFDIVWFHRHPRRLGLAGVSRRNGRDRLAAAPLCQNHAGR
jgi:hypothetical protein